MLLVAVVALFGVAFGLPKPVDTVKISYFVDPGCTEKAPLTHSTFGNNLCVPDPNGVSLHITCNSNGHPVLGLHFTGQTCEGTELAPTAIPGPTGCQLLPNGLYGLIECIKDTDKSANCVSAYGCCPDGVTGATGPFFEGCDPTIHNVNWGVWANPAAWTLTINVGDSVIWHSTDVVVPHTVTSGTTNGDDIFPDGRFGTAPGTLLFAPATFTQTFDTAGTYPYFCAIHPDFMVGTVIVVDPSITTPAPVAAPGQHFISWGLQFPVASFSIAIAVGDTVTWIWSETADPVVPHTVESGVVVPPGVGVNDGLFASGNPQQTSGTFSYTFNTAGTFPYFCGIHAAFMSGAITVQ